MEPLTIAGLTVLALLSLVIEYFTRVFSRWLGAAWALASGSTPGNSAEAIGHAGSVPSRLKTTHEARNQVESIPDRAERIVPSRNGHRIPVESLIQSDRIRQTYMPPGTTFADAQPTRPRSPEPDPFEVVRERDTSSKIRRNTTGETNPEISPAVRDLGSSEAEVGARILAEVTTVVAQLVSVENDLSPSGCLDAHTRGPLRLEMLAVNYDLDDLMLLANCELSQDVITYYRDVAKTAAELEEFLRNVSSTKPFEDGPQRMEQGREALQAAVAIEIARGDELIQCLRNPMLSLATLDSVSGESATHPAEQSITSS